MKHDMQAPTHGQAVPGTPGDHLLAVLAANAREHGSAVAMRERERGIWQETTWQALLDQVLTAAAGLQARGVAAGDKVLIVGDNRPALYFAMLGAIALRAVPSPAYPDSTPEQLLGQIAREGVRHAVAEDQEQVDKLLGLQGQYDGLELIIYDDPRGLEGSAPEHVIAFTALQQQGRQCLQQQPGLQQDLLGRASGDDVAILLHSSGTTGAPKGIPLKHRHVLFAVRSAAQAGYFGVGESHMAYMPIAWVGDFIFTIAAALALRFTVNIPEKQETVQRDLREIAPTVYFTSPRAWSTMLTRVQVGIAESTPLKRRLYEHFMPYAIALERRLLAGHQPGLLQRLWRGVGELLIYGPVKDQLGLVRARHAYTAGEAIGEDIFLFFRALGLPLRQFYGQTENSALCAAQEAGTVKLHTVGKPFPGMEVRISGTGEILVRGGNVFDGYFDDDKSTGEALQDGWLHTGDAGHLEDDGQLVVLGRVSEVVYTTGGARFIPTFIENQLKFSPYIKDVCVLGDGRDWLAALVAIDWEAVGHWAQERGVAYTSFADLSQQPPVYQLIAGLMRTVNGKLPAPTQIRRFVNLHKEFDPDDGEVTRTRKLRRGVIADHYGEIIEAMYRGDTTIEARAQITYETGESGELRRELAICDVDGAAAPSQAAEARA